MSQKDIAIVFDCGATNLRVIAMDKLGKQLASHSLPNETSEDPNYPGGRIWDLDKLWQKLASAAKHVTAEIDCNRIAGTTVTTFGVDGAFVDAHGKLLYPVVSWQCERTIPILANIEKYVSLSELYATSGVYPYAFNTINKMIWFRENKPNVLENAHRFLFMPSLLIHKLSGIFINDTTMMGTAMLADLKSRKMSPTILKAIGIEKELFGEIGEPGSKAGTVTENAEVDTGLPKGTPVLLAGHDTQFAIFGSGVRLNQPVLNSGTWEILMTRSKAFKASAFALDRKITTEADAETGTYNIGQNWLSSGVLEWFSRNFYKEFSGDGLYQNMIHDAEQEQPGANGIVVDPAFYDDGYGSEGGMIKGLTINTSRGQIYRAFLEGLAFRLREGLEALETVGSSKSESIICVGGGSKNRLWNQLRADVCKVPIQLIDQKETTVLGASMFVFTGVGIFNSLSEARKQINYNPQFIEPSINSEVYEGYYQNYLKLRSGKEQLQNIKL